MLILIFIYCRFYICSYMVVICYLFCMKVYKNIDINFLIRINRFGV